jgi:hypothetical protein
MLQDLKENWVHDTILSWYTVIDKQKKAMEGIRVRIEQQAWSINAPCTTSANFRKYARNTLEI